MNQVEIEDEIFHRCKQALNGAVVDLDPFPHFYIRDFLAENICFPKASLLLRGARRLPASQQSIGEKQQNLRKTNAFS